MSIVSNAPGEEPHATAALEAIGEKMLAALVSVRVWSLSLHDEQGDVLWLNESVMGPDEHEAVRSALEAFAGEGTPSRHEHDLGDGRIAVCLRAGRRDNPLLGLAMVAMDSKALASRTARDRLDPLQGMAALVDELADWLAEDVTATQTRLRALPEPHAAQKQVSSKPALTPERASAASGPAVLTLLDAESAPKPASDATPGAAGAAGPTAGAAHGGAATPVDPALDRHFAALRALPLVLYTQRLEPMAPGSRIRRFEILLRTGSEHGRTHAPVAMLDAAVKRGLGSVIDRRVVTELITWLAHHPDAWRTEPVLMSVNLSPSALVDEHFLKFLELCLAKAELPRGMLAFELDATLCAQQLQRTQHLGQMLSAFGCSLIIDDFTLRDALLDLLALKGLRMLKLHPDLTTNLTKDKRRQAIIAGIAQTARVLGMHTCAKRIETRTDQRWLAALKVDFAQGFAFGEPRPLEDLAGPPVLQPAPDPQ